MSRFGDLLGGKSAPEPVVEEVLITPEEEVLTEASPLEDMNKRELEEYGRTLGICYVGKIDLQAEMVKSGMAVAYLRYSDRYEDEQNYAKKVKAGMWAGEFKEPELWRRENRD